MSNCPLITLMDRARRRANYAFLIEGTGREGSPLFEIKGFDEYGPERNKLVTNIGIKV